MRSIRDESGSSLVSVLVAVGLSLGLTAMATKVFELGNSSRKSLDTRDAIGFARIQVFAQLDCKKTLNVAGYGEAKCDQFSAGIPLRRADGSVIGPIGNWSIKGRCSTSKGAHSNELIVSATKGGSDPLTKKSWAKSKAASDLFNGTTDLCRKYFRSDESQALEDREMAKELDCFWAARSRNGLTTSDRKKSMGFVKTYDSKNKKGDSWYGMQCRGRYNRTGCSIRNSQSKGDYDIRYINRGCYTDDEEWRENAILYMTCCKLK